MRRPLQALRFLLVLALIVLLPAGLRAADNELSDAEKADGWIRLFDGRTLDGWAVNRGPIAGWTVENGALKCLGHSRGDLFTLAQFDDFELMLDFRLARRANSGVLVRLSGPGTRRAKRFEIQVLDSFGRPEPDNHDCGGIYDVMAPRKDIVRPAGEWNHLEIICLGPVVRVQLNGEQVVEMDASRWTRAGRNPDGTYNKFSYALNTVVSGHLGLQDHRGVVWYKNIKLRSPGGHRMNRQKQTIAAMLPLLAAGLLPAQAQYASVGVPHAEPALESLLGDLLPPADIPLIPAVVISQDPLAEAAMVRSRLGYASIPTSSGVKVLYKGKLVNWLTLPPGAVIQVPAPFFVTDSGIGLLSGLASHVSQLDQVKLITRPPASLEAMAAAAAGVSLSPLHTQGETTAGTAPAVATDNQLTSEERSAGWKLLFDGKTLDGWGATGNRDAGWTVEEGTIKNLVHGGDYLYSMDQAADFILDLDFKVAPRTNSGVFVRWSDLNDPVNTGMEIQVLDSFGRVVPDRHDCGSLYDIMAPDPDVTRPAGEWNHFRIVCWGPVLRVNLNGEQVVEVDLSQWKEPGKNPDGTGNKFRYAYTTMIHAGHIGLQDHGGVVWYRNIKWKTLPKFEPPVHG